MEKTNPLLSIRGLNKQFTVAVLQDLDLQCYAGEVHALMGSNGAGKSTLCNIISGVLTANSGDMEFDGRPHAPESLLEAEAAGIYMVMQELNLFPTLSVAENLFFKQLGVVRGENTPQKTPMSGLLVDHGALREQSYELLARVGLNNIDPAMPVSELGLGQQQLLEIARVLHYPLRLLILDEPTAALTDPQIELLFEQINMLRERGCSVVYISHRMDEIRRVADRVSVLRDGRCVATQPVTDIDVDSLIHLMAGEGAATERSLADSAKRNRHTVMRVEHLAREGVFRDVSFEIRAGEILGIGGLIGSGRTEVMRCLFGADKADSGCLRFARDNFDQRHIHDCPQNAIANGVGLVVEDRKAQGLLLRASVADNIVLGQERRISSALCVLSSAREAELAEPYVTLLNIKYDSQQQAVGQLSGGNQQKVLIARWLSMELPILLFDEPTRGVDARTKQAIHRVLRDLVAAGNAVVMVSSETQELLTLSDRLIVMSNGRIAAEISAEEATQERILRASFRYYNDVGTSGARIDAT